MTIKPNLIALWMRTDRSAMPQFEADRYGIPAIFLPHWVNILSPR
jgi:hypothetical protein